MDLATIYFSLSFSVAFYGIGLFIFQFSNSKNKAAIGKLKGSYSGREVDSKKAWVIQELPSFIIAFFYLVKSLITNDKEIRYLVKLILFSLHYFNKSLVYPFTQTNPNKIPAIYVLNACIFTTINGFLQSYHTKIILISTNNIYCYIGLIPFLVGLFINIKCDRILVNIRKENKGYQIPRGNLFEYVSAGNYFGEVIEWFGFAIISGTPSSWAFFCFSGAYLTGRALQYHVWYKEKFPEYPRHRKAIIPFIL